ncbi:ABC transporter substrate-binding protein [Thermosipho sp. 1074]|nr:MULTISPECIES: metal ABC transporter substrate-binding protein [unclassified Thermosipho (in: thermotogales)]OOC44845.1 ABC transporter substrate-binding protein [Thermosipho sp. 1074]
MIVKKFFLLFLLFSSVMFSYVVVTINPYYLLVSELLKGVDDVKLLLPPNVNPHVYSLKVSDVKLLAKANLIIANGNLEPNLEKYDNVLYVKNYIPEVFIEHKNPHFWLDPYFVKFYIIPSLSEEFYKMYKDNKIMENEKKLLEKIDIFIKDAWEVLKTDGLVLVNHPSFYYFFKEFGIKIKWLEEGHNVSIGLKKIINTIKGRKLIALFTEKQQPESKIKVISKELKKKYYVLDPLGIDAKNFVDLYYKNLEIIRKALENE